MEKNTQFAMYVNLSLCWNAKNNDCIFFFRIYAYRYAFILQIYTFILDTLMTYPDKVP